MGTSSCHCHRHRRPWAQAALGLRDLEIRLACCETRAGLTLARADYAAALLALIATAQEALAALPAVEGAQEEEEIETSSSCR